MSYNRLADLLSLHNVPRWNCGLQFYRRQTVAEHSYNVACIAWQIVSMLPRYPPSLHYMILRWALCHDGPETFTGDVNHLLKKELPKDKIKEIEIAQCPWYEVETKYPNQLALAIVKIADEIDAVYWIDRQGATWEDVNDARVRAVNRIREYTARAVKEFGILELPSVIQHVMAGIESPAYPGTNLWPVDDTPQPSQPDPQTLPPTSGTA